MARQATLARFEVSGEILSEDILALLAAPACKLPGAELEEGDFTAAYDLLLERWQSIRGEIADYDTERLRRRWQLEVLELLGYAPQALRAHTRYHENLTIPLTHRAGELPCWLLPYGQDFDAKIENGKRKRSPHEQFQEYLDATDDEWGLLFNGKALRLLHDYHKTLTRNYVEADLENIFDALDVDAFRAVWRIFNSSRFDKNANGARPLELLRDASRQEGATVGKELRLQVRKALEVLGNGFLSADRDGLLLQELRHDPAAIAAFYPALLRVVYRLLFLLYIENRPNWTPAQNRVWADSYSISRLREQAEEFGIMRANGEDAWEGLKVVSRIVREGSEFFGIHPYGGELFDDAKLWLLKDAALPNAELLQAIRLLTLFERDKQLYRVNFRTLDIEALGSVYEGLLDVTAFITPDGRFAFAAGTERKLTGSYYTPKELVAELIKSALVPVIIDRLQGKVKQQEREEALLSIRVVDPACGSGAFLVQALDKLAEALVKIRFGDEEPGDLDVREARRDVVRQCIHGVDLNPQAVDLCRFVLWLNVAHPNFPLSYLEPLIKCGNSLVGVPLPAQVYTRKAAVLAERERLNSRGERRAAAKVKDIGWPNSIPNEAFTALTGDDKALAHSARKRNEEGMDGQLDMEISASAGTPELLAGHYRQIRDASDATIGAVHEAEGLYAGYLQSSDYRQEQLVANLWCAAFFWHHLSEKPAAPTTQWLRMARSAPNRLPAEMVSEIDKLYQDIHFFHWQLEFPDVFRAGGFDCVLGNPPWERIKIQEEEFFAIRKPEIAAAPNKTARQKLIDVLVHSDPSLSRAFQEAKHAAEAVSKYVRSSERFQLTSSGDVNTYALFSEQFLNLLSSLGRSGIIVPIGIATDDANKHFFNEIMNRQSIIRLVGFENEDFIFIDVHNEFKFCVLTLGGSDVRSIETEMVFFCRKFNDSYNSTKLFNLTLSDLELLNPNTHTCPVFRTINDAIFTKSIYNRIPYLVKEEIANYWGIIYHQGLFHSSNDSGLFNNNTYKNLSANGAELHNNIFLQGNDIFLPFYEGRMIWHFDHRWAFYLGKHDIIGRPSRKYEGWYGLNQNKPFEYAIPRYWINRNCIDRRIPESWNRQWFIAFRDVTSNVVERTAVFTILPFVGISDQIGLIFTSNDIDVDIICCLLGNFNSMVQDYIVRQKIGGSHLKKYMLFQLSILPPIAYTLADVDFITPRILELVYTSYDLKSFAEDLGYNEEPYRWDEERRAQIRAELDAYYARLYGLTRKQLRYILDPHGLSASELEDIIDPWEDPTCAGPDLLPAEPALDFPSETFRVLKNNDEKAYGCYRTRRLVLDAWQRLEAEYGPVIPVNYREMLTLATAKPTFSPPTEVMLPAMMPTFPTSTPLLSMVAEPEAVLEVRRPDDPPQMKLTLETPKPAVTANTPQPDPTRDMPASGMRVRVNGRPGTLITVVSSGLARKVTVKLDGEKTPRIFVLPPAVIEMEEER